MCCCGKAEDHSWSEGPRGRRPGRGQGKRRPPTSATPAPGGANPAWLRHSAPDRVLGITLGGSVLGSAWEKRPASWGERGGHRGRAFMSCPPASLDRASGSSLFAHRRVDHTFCNSVFPGSVEGACEVRNPHNSETPSVLGREGSAHTPARVPCPVCLMTHGSQAPQRV